MGKSKRRHSSSKSKRSSSLADQILAGNSAKASTRVKNKEHDEKDDEYVDEKLSRKILEQARRQQEELEEEHGVKTKKARFQTVSLGAAEDSDSGEDSDASEADNYYEDIEINKEDEEALERFMSDKPVVKRTLADIIMEKLTEKQTEVRTQLSDNASIQVQQLDDRVVAMYRGVRDILAKYRSGKLPKALKVVPHLANWEQILFITEPERWSAAAMYQVTRIFASNLNAKMAQRFFYLVLFPRIRDDISEYKRLNFHLYMATRKALFKPAAFFKGILLPLCECGTCTLREAVIVSSILTKNSIPMLHSAAAILKIAEMDYTGANSIFLRSLLDKKYALPYRVIDAVVFHFIRFKTDHRELPVLWHQCLLTFVQRYKQDVSSEQKAALYDVMRTHKHHSITPEIRRELESAKCRDEEIEQPQTMDDDDDE